MTRSASLLEVRNILDIIVGDGLVLGQCSTEIHFIVPDITRRSNSIEEDNVRFHSAIWEKYPGRE